MTAPDCSSRFSTGYVRSPSRWGTTPSGPSVSEAAATGYVLDTDDGIRQ